MTIQTKAGDYLVDKVRDDVQEIEEEVRERIEDAIRALDRHSPINAENETDEANKRSRTATGSPATTSSAP
mgnify:CR=1 FL=1